MNDNEIADDAERCRALWASVVERMRHPDRMVLDLAGLDPAAAIAGLRRATGMEIAA